LTRDVGDDARAALPVARGADVTDPARVEPAHGWLWWVLRGALVLLAGVSLYLLGP